jgi:DNA repair protein RecN (Recombination protein N)
MLRSLSIQNVVLIDRLEINFSAGLCVLTGETGAGKSILLDALGLALGERANASLIRPGAPQASVSAAFAVKDNPPLFAILEAQGLATEEEIILRRIIMADGKSRAYINDHPVSAGLLKEIATEVVEIHGQFDHALQPATHRALLDNFSGSQDLLNHVETAYTSYQEATRTLENAEKFLAEQRHQEDFLRYAVEEFEKISPQTGEEEELLQRRTLLQNKSKVIEGIQSAVRTVGGEGGILDKLNTTLSTIEKIATYAPQTSDALLVRLNHIHSELQEVEATLEHWHNETDGSEGSLETLEDRLYALRALARKHGGLVSELPILYEKFKADLSVLAGGREGLQGLEKKLEEAKTAYVQQAKQLHTVRLKHATLLGEAVTNELAPLKLGEAQFKVIIEEAPESVWGPAGIDHVEFQVKTNAGLPYGALSKIASGGERSRFMLALKVVLCKARAASILVFDEIDQGVGGAVASAIGERLATLGAHQQVLAITHSPQVAAYAQQHFLVQKRAAAGQTTITEVLTLTPSERQEELARMLSGDRITEQARAAAHQLIQTAA